MRILGSVFANRGGSVRELHDRHDSLLSKYTGLLTSRENRRRRLAERVACRVCGSRSLNYVGRNQLECSQCHEEQWYTLNMEQVNAEPEPMVMAGRLTRVLVRLGSPQPAFWQLLQKPTLFYWFRCANCKTVSTDYPHGFRRHLVCPSCQSKSYF